MAGARARRARCGRRRAPGDAGPVVRGCAGRAICLCPAPGESRFMVGSFRLVFPSVPCPWGVQRPGRTRGSRGPGRLLRGVRNAARDPARPRPGGSGRQPRGSRIGDVTWARIVRGGLARIERRRIPSRWARTARGGVDCVALGSHYASRDWPALAPARPGIGLRWPESRRGSGRGGGEGYSGVVLKMWVVRVVVVVCSDGSFSSEGLLRRRVSASSGCDAGGR